MEPLELTSDLPTDLWHNLQYQTESALAVTNASDFAYFKFIYLGNVKQASTVLTEFHLVLDWETPGREIQTQLRQAIGSLHPTIPIEISFAGKPLGENQNPAELGSVYGDKIYFGAENPQKSDNILGNSQKWFDYFQRVATAINNDPSLYQQIIDAACKGMENTPNTKQWTELTWKLLLLARNLPGIYADKATGRMVLKPTQQLIQTLKASLEQNNQGAVYHTANILEWLAYLKPRMFEGVDLYDGEQSRKALAQTLLSSINPSRNLPGRVRMEAAWAIGWASVASQAFGQEVYETLVTYAQQEENKSIAMTLRCAALRSFLYPTPYYRAAISQQGGWYQASILDEQQFRQLALSGKHDEALKHFREKLVNSLPPAQEN